MKVEIIKTRDGSSSLFVPELNETYHSTHGAIAESIYVFIKQGLEHHINTHHPKTVNILEVGFGTGLNALVTAIFAQNSTVQINYYTLEPFPLDVETVNKLNYIEQLDEPDSEVLFRKIHDAKWEESVSLFDNFSICKMQKKLQGLKNDITFDLVYFDAFAPSKQPDMWREAVFENLHNLMNPNAILITYCAQGQFKRNLKSVGFHVESLAGPPPKKEMVRAHKVKY